MDAQWQRRNFVILCLILTLVPSVIFTAVFALDEWNDEHKRHTWTVESAKEEIRKSPSDGRAYSALSIAYMDRKQYALAVEACKKAARLLPKDSESHYYLGEALMANEDRTDARAEFKTAINLDGDDPRSWVTTESKRLLKTLQ